MRDNFVKLNFDRVLQVEKLVTVFYMEFSKDFHYEGERHDFWEMVYIDKGEMLCTAEDHQFTLKSGELTFHKPNEFHNLSGNRDVAPNVSILTFECRSRAMKHFEGKIFRLDEEEKKLISMLFEEALSCYRLEDENDPLLQKLIRLEDAPFGSSQMTKNLLEIFLIKLQRNKESVSKQRRFRGLVLPYEVEEILDYLSRNLYGRVTIADVAAAVGKSPSTVKKLFSEHMPTGIIDHYNELKIKEAKKLIREEKYNFTQIADLLGFDTPQYFSKCFKDRTHRTPGEYKKSIMK